MISWNDGLLIFGKFETAEDKWEYFNEDMTLSKIIDIEPLARKAFSCVLLSSSFTI